MKAFMSFPRIYFAPNKTIWGRRIHA